MEDMDEYHRCLDIIAECNHIETIEPENAEDKVVEDEDQVDHDDALGDIHEEDNEEKEDSP